MSAPMLPPLLPEVAIKGDAALFAGLRADLVALAEIAEALDRAEDHAKWEKLVEPFDARVGNLLAVSRLLEARGVLMRIEGLLAPHGGRP